MPAISAISLNDGKTTPVAHSFAPRDIKGSVATFEDRSSGVALGYPVLTVGISRPSKTSPLTKVRLKIQVPVLETVGTVYVGNTPAPVKAYETGFDGTFFLPMRGGLQDRKDIHAYVKNFLASAFCDAIVQQLESVY
ncbi:TPA_asm: coat protein [ssRNA phage SRR7976325_15]|uniref:Coat protein n=1 Tax=ssRNA phage SRR7976325_15 TaxID=2786702 RepID=A0A8S5L5M7_9VIRU|nr:coat protein [ssRNA phage SRR7976325_15]DAD52751.1 TPA_asm: coat protein [ssRNA phage SRR7976325_15]